MNTQKICFGLKIAKLSSTNAVLWSFVKKGKNFTITKQINCPDIMVSNLKPDDYRAPQI